MKVGDLVVTKYDLERGHHLVGVVVKESSGSHPNKSVKVHWIIKNLIGDNSGWWHVEKLKKFE